jgi:glutamyl-tRNA synthetase
LTEIVALEQDRLKTLVDAPHAFAFYMRDPQPEECVALLGSNRFAARHALASLGSALSTSHDRLRQLGKDAWTASALAARLDEQVDALGWARAELLMPLRIAISGREATPPLFDTMVLVGCAATLRRLEAVLALLPRGEASAPPRDPGCLDLIGEDKRAAVNTYVGTQRIPDGAQVTVDVTQGTVDVHD